MANERKIILDNTINVELNGELELKLERSERALASMTETANKAQAEVDALRSQTEKLTDELSKIKQETGIAEKERELTRFTNTAAVAAQEFDSFLKSVHLLDEEDHASISRFSELFDAISNGSKTAGQAIAQVKTELGYLFEGSGGGDLSTDIMRSMQSTLEAITESITSIMSKLSEFEQNGIKAVGGGESQQATSDFADALHRVQEAASGMSGDVKESYESITQLIRAIKEYSEIDGSKLYAISSTFSNMGAVGDGSFSSKKVDNIVDLANRLRQLGDSAAFKFDITGLDFKVDTSSLNALSKFLVSINGISVPDLSSLSNVNLSGFSNVKISSTIGNIGKLIEQVKDISPDDVKKLGQLAEASAKAYATRAAGKANAAAIETQAIAKAEISEATARSVEYKGIAEAEVIEAQTKAMRELAEARRDEAVAKKEQAEINRDAAQKRAEEAQETREAAKAAKEEAAAKKEAADVLKNYNAAREQYQKLSEKTSSIKGPIDLGGIGSQFQELQKLIAVMGDANASVADKTSAFEQFQAVSKQLGLDIDQLAQKEKAEAAAAKEEANAKKEQEKAAQDAAKTAAAAAKAKAQADKAALAEQHKGEQQLQRAIALEQQMREAHYEGADAVTKLIGQYNDGTITADQFRNELDKLNISFKEQQASVNPLISTLGKWGSTLQNSLSRYVPFLNAAATINMAIRGLREAIKTTIEFDDVMTQMQIVTRESDETIEAFGKNMFNTAKQIGASTTELIDSATVFARLGYSLEESQLLAKYTGMLQNVGDIEVSAAQDAITAIFKAFSDVDISQIESVMDRMVTVGKRLPNAMVTWCLVIGYIGQRSFGFCSETEERLSAA